ncbi:hypothetical protein GWK47_009607 [Chionoecetes opilio]|uniref:Uncharacterized protein n=1 Tax=Chionoecetes opilio TaxID=41210 RepID=A0A8J4XYH9_CHIOP|nr:hypothetical protein GWK47_009607 [Chionoecetes opilio]
MMFHPRCLLVVGVEDLRSLTQHARNLLQRGLVFAVHTTEGRSRQAKISLEDDRLFLHCLRDQPLPRGAVTLQVGQPLLSAALVFFFFFFFYITGTGQGHNKNG